MKLDAVMVTDVGVVRDHNEDSAHVDPSRRFFIVADGMGGHAAGEVASAMAVESVKATLDNSTSIIDAFAQRPTDASRRALVQTLQGAVLSAHQAVFQRGARESDKAGMGTTLDVVVVAGREAFVAHVGDSRTYLIRDGKASQLTTDHTVAEVLVIEGKLTIEEAMVSPYRTVLVNAIGVAADVGVEMAHLQLREGDKLLVCSDGLHDYFLAEQEIADTLSEGEPIKSLTAMVETAKERGGHDNITGVVVTVLEMQDSVPAPIERDETAPVSIGDDDFEGEERTENISPREIDKLGLETISRRAGRQPTGDPASDAHASRPTAPMLVVTPPGSNAHGSDATDPGIVTLAPDDDLDAESEGEGEDDTDRGAEPGTKRRDDRDRIALVPSSRKRSIELASTVPPPVGQTADGANADGGKAPAGSPAHGTDRAGDDAVPSDSLALGDTGPVPKAEPEKSSGPVGS